MDRAEAIAAALKEEPGRWRELREEVRSLFPDLEPVERARAVALLARALKVSRQVLLDDLRGDAEAAEARTLAACLVEAVEAEVRLVRTPGGELFAEVDGLARVIGSEAFRRWLARFCRERLEELPGGDALTIARSAIEATAEARGEALEVGLRVLALGDRTCLDPGGTPEHVIEVRAGGWTIAERPPEVLFRRSQAALALPEPRRGPSGALDRYLDLLRVPAEARPRVTAWTLAALRGRPPYPLLVIYGEQGTGKTTAAEAIARLVDPQQTGVRSPPREARDLVAAARNAHVIAFDNVSTLSPDMSDDLCRLATGAGIGGRKLYTDYDEATFFAARPVIMTTIDGVPARPDLLDRSYLVELEVLDDEDRMPDAELRAALEELWPAALAELLDLLARALERLPEVKLARLPRMADAARLAEAAGLEGFAEAAIAAGRGALRELAAQDPVARAIERLLEGRGEWHGSASDLAEALRSLAGDRPPRGWPDTARAIAHRLRRLAPALRALGIEAAFAREGRGRERTIALERTLPGGGPKTSSASSASSAPTVNPLMAQENHADGSVRRSSADRPQIVRRSSASSADRPHRPQANPLTGKDYLAPADDADDADGLFGASPAARDADRLGEAAAALAEGDLERGRKLAEAALGRGIEGAKLWELAKLGVGAADLIAAELHNLAEGQNE